VVVLVLFVDDHLQRAQGQGMSILTVDARVCICARHTISQSKTGCITIGNSFRSVRRNVGWYTAHTTLSGRKISGCDTHTQIKHTHTHTNTLRISHSHARTHAHTHTHKHTHTHTHTAHMRISVGVFLVRPRKTAGARRQCGTGRRAGHAKPLTRRPEEEVGVKAYRCLLYACARRGCCCSRCFFRALPANSLCEMARYLAGLLEHEPLFGPGLPVLPRISGDVLNQVSSCLDGHL
jgi:hypothetical protein